jgi:hypothetical protein
VALGINEDVLGLQVPVRDALLLVEEFQDEDDLGGVEARGGLIEAPRAAEVAEDLAAGAVIELCPLEESRQGQTGRTSMYRES